MPITPTKISSLPALGASPASGSFIAVSQLVSGSYVLYKVTTSELLGSAITSINGLTAQSQSLAIGTSGTSPNWSSSSSTHTLNIPLASTSLVTAGLISNSDYSAAISPFTTSHAQNRVVASPTSSSGTLSVRALVSDDLPTVPTSKGGTGTTTSFTQGRVVFSGASGVYSQDSNITWDNTNKVFNANKIAINDTYNAGGLPYGFSHTATDATYEFVFRDSGGTDTISSQSGSLFISSSKIIRNSGSGGGIILGSEPINGDGVKIVTLGGGVFTGTNNFSVISPVIRSVTGDDQKGINLVHTIEQNSSAIGVIRSIHTEITQVVNPQRLYVCTTGQFFVTIVDTRGTVDFSAGNTVTGTGIPAATTILSIVGNQINLSNAVTQTVTGEFLTNTSVTYSASDIYDYRAFSASVGNSVTQKAIDLRQGSTVIFQVAGDGSFTFKDGTLAPAQTGWTITNPTTNRSIDVSTITLGNLSQVVGTLLQDLIDKGIIKP